MGSRKRAQQISNLELRISEMETFIMECEHRLQAESEASHFDEVRRLAGEHSNAKVQLETLTESWVALSAD